jgi:hypothetical protein
MFELDLTSAFNVVLQAAGYYQPERYVTYAQPDPRAKAVLGFILLLLIAGLVLTFLGWLCSPRTRYTVTWTDQYNQQAEQHRAWKKQLDAEAQYFESYLRHARTQAELGELPEIIEHEKAKRGISGGAQ